MAKCFQKNQAFYLRQFVLKKTPNFIGKYYSAPFHINYRQLYLKQYRIKKMTFLRLKTITKKRRNYEKTYYSINHIVYECTSC